MKQSNGFLPESMATEESESVHEIAEANQETASLTGTNEIPQVFTLAPIKAKGLPSFKLTALYKSRLRCCIFLQFCLFIVMCLKLSEDILDRLDIFILQIEELYIPKPKVFEYLYASHICFAFIALRGLSKNLGSLKSYAAGSILLGICPLLIAAVYYFNDILEYADKKDEADIEKWQGYPVACYWYVFILVAIQVHLFSLYFCAKLLKIWRSKMKKN